MKTINVDCRAHPYLLQLGYQGENGVKEVVFDTTGFYDEFGDGQAELIVQRSDNTSYPVDLDCYGNTWAWTISATDTAFSGDGQAQLLYYVGETLKKSVVYMTYVSPSIAQGEAPPDPYESYLERMTAIGAQVAQSAEEVRTAVSQAESDITEAISQAESDITTAVTQAESSITSTAQTATQSITATAQQALTTINAAVTQAQEILEEMQELLENHNGITYEE